MQAVKGIAVRLRQWAGVLGLMAMLAPWAAQAQQAGEVEFSRGAGFAQTQGQAPRALGKGLVLKEGDRLTTADGATAIIKMADGTRMTLRPNTEMVMQKYQFNQGTPDENGMVMQLLRGGLRAVTGLISKGTGEAKIQTSTTTIGIRGTDFDARLCTSDCKEESSKVNELPRMNSVVASAKLVSLRGEVYATDIKNIRRKLAEGAAVYPGEQIDTLPGAQGVLVFRDESRLTLGSGTSFKVEVFTYDGANPSEGKFLVSLLRGSMRAFTGLIGKANNRNVGFTTATATIGIRGTGLDLDCADPTACSFFTWLGTIEVTPQGQSALQVLQAGQGLFVSRDGIRALTTSPLINLPRPDTVPVDTQQLFSSGGVTPEDEGLFVFVRDGHIELTTGTQKLHLGRGEAGVAGNDGKVGRPINLPLFIQYDQVPMPNTTNPLRFNVLNELRTIESNVCR